jgi:hypothetical protein
MILMGGEYNGRRGFALSGPPWGGRPDKGVEIVLIIVRYIKYNTTPPHN